MPSFSGRLSVAFTMATLTLVACSRNSEAPPPPPPSQPSSINLSPPFKVGQKFTLVADVSETSHSHIILFIKDVTTPQNDYEDKKFTGHLEGEGEVLGVFPNGGIQKISLAVTSFKAIKDGNAIPNLPGAGAKIIAAREGDKIAISVDGAAADPTAAAAINELLPLDDEKFTQQELFGPAQPVSIDATWPVNATDVENGLVASGIASEAKGAKGSMKLESVEGGDGGSPVSVVSGGYTVASFKLPLPDTMTVDSGVLSAAVSFTIPASTTHGTLKTNRNLTTKTLAHGVVSGASMKLEITGQQARDVTITVQ